MQNPGKLPNQATFELKDGQDSAEANVLINSRKIGLIHGVVDNPGAKFDVVVKDMSGFELKRLSFQTANNRFGERINLPLTDNYGIIKLENISGAKKVDIFLE